MRLYRITNRAFAVTAEAAFGGQGGLYGSGRWHHCGNPIIYTASHASLALLEVLAHLDKSHLPGLLLWTVEVPDAEIVAADPLPADWKTNLDATREYGTAWIGRNASVGLLVPSVLFQSENNVLLNPMHPAFSMSWVHRKAEPVQVDFRLL